VGSFVFRAAYNVKVEDSYRSIQGFRGAMELIYRGRGIRLHPLFLLFVIRPSFKAPSIKR